MDRFVRDQSQRLQFFGQGTTWKIVSSSVYAWEESISQMKALKYHKTFYTGKSNRILFICIQTSI